ncbi:MAG: cell division protein FtsQ/DivIB [Fimbriimonadaceae bacterium]
MDAVLVLAIGLNVAFGIWRSPLLALRRVHVVGAQGPDRVAIEAILQGQAGRAALQVRPLEVETAVQALPEIDSATFIDNVFGSGRLVVHYRTPAARLGLTGIALDGMGRIWKTRQSLRGLPAVELPASALDAGLSLTRSATLVGVAELAQKLPGVWPAFNGEIVLDDAGRVCLNSSDSGRVVLGATDAMDEKLSRLARLLRDRPELFSGAIEVNLTAPAHPVFSHVTSGSKTAH